MATKKSATKKRTTRKKSSSGAGKYVAQQMRERKHGKRESREQAIAIGLSKARRAGEDVPPLKKGKKRATKKAAKKTASKKTTTKKRASKKSTTKRKRSS